MNNLFDTTDNNLKSGDIVKFKWDTDDIITGKIISVKNENAKSFYKIKSGYDVYLDVADEKIIE